VLTAHPPPPPLFPLKMFGGKIFLQKTIFFPLFKTPEFFIDEKKKFRVLSKDKTN